MLEEILRVEHLTKHFVKKGIFGSKKSVARAADDVSFTLNKGDALVLAGESGSGKSTIAKMILGSVDSDSGDVFFEGKKIAKNPDGLKKLRMNCQMVHQDPYDSINPGMRIADIIAEPLEIHGYGDKEARKKRVADVLGEVRLDPSVAKKHPHMLSGGQRQRVVLARALALKPKVIIADEPVSMLDVSIRAEMLELMSELQARHGISFIYITHDLATARYFGKTIAIMYLGKIVESGPIDDILDHPWHPYTQALIDAISEPDPKNLHRDRVIRIDEPRSIDVYEGCRFRARCPYAIDKCIKEPELEGDQRQVACFAKLE